MKITYSSGGKIRKRVRQVLTRQYRSKITKLKVKGTNKIYAIKSKLRHGNSDFFDSVLIETSTACNRKCIYCPNSQYDRGDIKNQKHIDFNLYKKIIKELKDLNFKGIIKPFYYSEPLLNEKLEELAEYTKKELPKCKIQIATNGDLLKLDRYQSLVKSGIDAFYITTHKKKAPKHIEELLKELKKRKDKIRIHYIDLNEDSDLDNRGGLVEVKNKNKIPRCVTRPSAILISNKGDVFLCCNDYFRKITFGNIKKEKMVDIWFKPNYVKIRKELEKGIYKLEICKKCTE